MPLNIPPTGPRAGPMSERLVFGAFQQLPDSYTLLWDVPVGLFGRPRPNLRQIDLLVLHEQLGIFVIEVKGGEISSADGVWSTRPKGGEDWAPLDRSPFSQVADQRFALQRYLKSHLRIDASSFCHAVAFPGCTVSADLGADAPRELSIDESDLRNPVAALHRVRDHWGDRRPLSSLQVDGIVAALKPDFEMTTLAATAAEATGLGLERETRRQVAMVEDQIATYRLLLESSRVVVLGGAGTGKTVIAAERARQLASTGARTLLLCHRSAVRSFLYTLLGIAPNDRNFDGRSPNLLQVSNWSSLAQAVGSSDGRGEVKPLASDIQDRFFAFRDEITPYQALVIDEGQEFTADQVESLCWLLEDPTESPFYLLADPFQHSGLLSTPVRDRLEKRVRYDWTPPLDAQKVVLTTNCRNSQQILDLAGAFYPGVLQSPVVDGPEPEFHLAPPDDVVGATARVVAGLVASEGIRPHQVLTVLLGAQPSESNKSFSRVNISTIDVDRLFRFPLTPKDLRVAVGTPDSVQGLEADVVVVGYLHSPEEAVALRELYISLTRAKSILHVVSDIGEDEFKKLAVSESEDSEDAGPQGAVS